MVWMAIRLGYASHWGLVWCSNKDKIINSWKKWTA